MFKEYIISTGLEMLADHLQKRKKGNLTNFLLRPQTQLLIRKIYNSYIQFVDDMKE